MKTFNVPVTYRSPLITAIKNRRKQQDKMKKDFTPALLDLGDLHIYLARHFGFCYGVENAIEISFRTVDEHPGKRIFLLSEMIHNPRVNADLQARGVRFLQDTQGRELVPFDELSADDIVIIPAFGTTLEIEKRLQEAGIPTEKFNTTCPFVEKVWNRSGQIAQKEYSVLIHGKPGHEETRATFSHAASQAPALVLKDMEQARLLAEYILGTRPVDEFHTSFKGQYSEGFDPAKDLERIGVVNQTTMLASDTQAIADFLKQTMIKKYGLADGHTEERFADTRDTLCYATLDNQTAVTGLLETRADLAIVVGGYNSSNTSHLVELCEERLPTYFISAEEKILSPSEIFHYNFHNKQELLTRGWLPGTGRPETKTLETKTLETRTLETKAPETRDFETGAAASAKAAAANVKAATPSGNGLPAYKPEPVRILLTSGASCPDSVVEAVIRKIAGFYPGAEEYLEELIASSL